MADEIIFEGVCPHCSVQSRFSLASLLSHDAGWMIGLFLFGLMNPLQGMMTALMPKDVGKVGKLGQCKSCHQVVLKCPRCGSINKREYQPDPCPSCGKIYSHP
jgi:hypothetical protein